MIKIKTKTIFVFMVMSMIALLVYYFYPEKKLPKGSVIEKIQIEKSKRQMFVYANGKVLKVYSTSLSMDSKGKKVSDKDNKTPEGMYVIDGKGTQTCCYKYLHISYPDKADKKAAAALGVDPGGQIEIHGLRKYLGFIGKFHRLINWTQGCIGVTNWEIDELYEAVKIGTPIEIMK